MKLTITITTDRPDHITAAQAIELKHELIHIIERFEDPMFFHKIQKQVNGDGITLKGCTIHPIQNMTVHNVVEIGQWEIDPAAGLNM
jgi:hypothetical protein